MALEVISGNGETIKDLPVVTEAQSDDLMFLESQTEGTKAMPFGEITKSVAKQMEDTKEYQDLNKGVEDAVAAAGAAQKKADDEIAKMAQYNERLEAAESNVETLQEDVGKKLSKPADGTDKAGYVYQKEDGSVVLAKALPDERFKYTIIVDNGADGTPEAVEYADDCVGFNPASGSSLNSWKDTALLKEYFRPCVIKPEASTPEYYLNPEKITQRIEGGASVLTGGDGDVMVQVKKLYGKVTKAGSKITYSLSNVKEDGSWFCFNEVAGVEKDYTYRARYMGGFYNADETELRSVSGVAKVVNKNRNAFRELATARGEGYHQNNIYLIFLWEWMYLLLYKNRNSQSALGQGRTLGTNTANVNCGWSDNYGCCYGDQGGVNGVVFLWVEDFYGDTWEFADGVCYVNNRYMLTRDPEKYNDTGSGYEIELESGLKAATDHDKYIVEMAGTNDVPFLPVKTGGSSGTFWCDEVYVADAVQVVPFGGGWSSAATAGAFSWYLNDSASSAYSSIGSRLCRA